ncbi:MAG: hypothetical protein SLAVMIC_00775 [uncultured marine phage]|uniref:Uncharacterized protein n=1 Tax=uncultured marine phage TaxID=707152 RepID=A0A8D9CER9_9VIRU|nr:MAG: hypothetical protein SLAVMIC_00775 [uncultured marine phage]
MKQLNIKMMVFTDTLFSKRSYKETIKKIKKKYGDLNLDNYTKYLMDEDKKKNK